jgi:hypothetical protein
VECQARAKNVHYVTWEMDSGTQASQCSDLPREICRMQGCTYSLGEIDIVSNTRKMGYLASEMCCEAGIDYIVDPIISAVHTLSGFFSILKSLLIRVGDGRFLLK